MFEKSDRFYLAAFLIAGLTTLPFSVLHTPEESYSDLQKDLSAQTIASIKMSGPRVLAHHTSGKTTRTILPFGSTFPDQAIARGVPVVVKDDALWIGIAIAFFGQIFVGAVACLIIFATRAARK